MVAPDEITVQVFRDSNGVRVTHIRTGTVAYVEAARSQHLNRATAIEMIEAALSSQHMQGARCK